MRIKKSIIMGLSAAPLAQKDFVHRYDEYFEQQRHGK